MRRGLDFEQSITVRASHKAMVVAMKDMSHHFSDIKTKAIRDHIASNRHNMTAGVGGRVLRMENLCAFV